MRRKVRATDETLKLGMRELVTASLRQAVMAVAAVAPAFGICFLGRWDEGFTLLNAAVLGGAVMVAVAIYGGAAVVLRLDEVEPVMGKVRRLVGRLRR